MMNPLDPTSEEEAEALKAAPPWRGFWIEPPTLKQRFKEWVRYIRYLTTRAKHTAERKMRKRR